MPPGIQKALICLSLHPHAARDPRSGPEVAYFGDGVPVWITPPLAGGRTAGPPSCSSVLVRILEFLNSIFHRISSHRISSYHHIIISSLA